MSCDKEFCSLVEHILPLVLFLQLKASAKRSDHKKQHPTHPPAFCQFTFPPPPTRFRQRNQLRIWILGRSPVSVKFGWNQQFPIPPLIQLTISQAACGNVSCSAMPHPSQTKTHWNQSSDLQARLLRSRKNLTFRSPNVSEKIWLGGGHTREVESRGQTVFRGIFFPKYSGGLGGGQVVRRAGSRTGL